MSELFSNLGQFGSGCVIQALGRRGTPRKLGAKAEELAKVMYKLTHAQSYTGMNLLVVGSGDSAMEAAIGLARKRGIE
jgi:thioredoxin reductase